MRKLLFSLLAAGLIGTSAFALTGQPPIPATGPGLVDGTWLNGLAGGTNQIYASGLTSTGGVSSTALQLSQGIRLFEIDTAPTSNGGVNLPVCVAGGDISVYNATSNVLNVYPSLLINTTTATQDTLDGAYGFIAVPVTSVAEFYCARNGKWAH